MARGNTGRTPKASTRIRRNFDAITTIKLSLQNLALLTGTGFISRIGTDQFTTRSIVMPAAGLTITNGDGVAGNPTISLANDLAGLEGIATNGIAARTTTSTWTTRTITGTANQVIVSNGDGIAGNPTLTTPQNIHTGATPTFAGLTITSIVSMSGTSITLTDAVNYVFGTTTGSKIGTATTQKIAFHGSTPVVQRAGSAQAAVTTTVGAAVDTTPSTNVSPYGYTETQADAIVTNINALRVDLLNAVTLVNEMRAALVEKGLVKGSA